VTLPAVERSATRTGQLSLERVPVGVVLVNWRGVRDTLECLESLVRASPAPARIVVVDNGSGDGSAEEIERWARGQGLPFAGHAVGAIPTVHAEACWLTVLSATTNAGFCGGNNIGLSYLDRDPSIEHYVLLNNDTTVATDFFAEMWRAARTGGRVGLVGSTIFEADGRRVWYAGGVSRPLRALIEHRHDLPADDRAVDTEFVCGCVMLITREALETLGPLPECYFPGYCEDAEYSYRARARGFRLLYAPRARVVHKVGASFGSAEQRPSAAFALVRHRTFFVRRNLTGWRRLAALGYLVATKPARGMVEVLRGHPRLGWAIVRGLLAGLLSRAARG
jgi:GT2 family glycosyltransferase